jgi:hypothetical protein|eukprot:COSAG01_NODE_192_length_22494_cov_100.193384_11_plen_188_part_00
MNHFFAGSAANRAHLSAGSISPLAAEAGPSGPAPAAPDAHVAACSSSPPTEKRFLRQRAALTVKVCISRHKHCNCHGAAHTPSVTGSLGWAASCCTHDARLPGGSPSNQLRRTPLALAYRSDRAWAPAPSSLHCAPCPHGPACREGGCPDRVYVPASCTLCLFFGGSVPATGGRSLGGAVRQCTEIL